MKRRIGMLAILLFVACLGCADGSTQENAAGQPAGSGADEEGSSGAGDGSASAEQSGAGGGGGGAQTGGGGGASADAGGSGSSGASGETYAGTGGASGSGTGGDAAASGSAAGGGEIAGASGDAGGGSGGAGDSSAGIGGADAGAGAGAGGETGGALADAGGGSGGAGAGAGGEGGSGGAGVSMSEDIFACDNGSQCGIFPAWCCWATCGTATFGDVRAINVSRSTEYFADCTDLNCPNCPTYPLPSIIAICDNGRCEAIDIAGDRVSECASDDDCAVRVPDCCECGADLSPERLIAYNPDEYRLLESYLCPVATMCALCAPIYPANAVARCADDGHCTVEIN